VALPTLFRTNFKAANSAAFLFARSLSVPRNFHRDPPRLVARFNGPPATYFAQQQIQDFGTVRARLGWLPTNNVLLYATGGFAYGRVKDTVSITAASNAFLAPLTYFCSLAAGVTEVPNCFLGNNSRWETGWTAGAGLEYSPWEHISFKVEYLFVGLGNGGNVNVVAQSTNGVPATPASFTSAFSRTDFNVVRGGINWKFY
jgi:outer membrane immunogenic protein